MPDYYQTITDRIVEKLEAGGLEAWRKPWRDMAENGMPFNGSSCRPYHGVNVLLLAFSGYADSRWYTYRQAAELGAHVRKGEKATQIVYWNPVSKKATDANGEETTRSIPLLRVFSIFNAEQVDGLKVRPAASQPIDLGARYRDAKEVLEATGAVVEHRGDRACFAPSLDRILLPRPEAFTSIEEYWATRAHETIHWTGHPSRLDRTFGKRFGDSAYAVEELVAEMGAAFVCARLGIAGDLQHPEYLASWLGVLKADKRALFTASAAARKAADLILPPIVLEDDKAEAA